MSKRVLQIDSDNQPLGFVSLHRAVSMIYNNKASVAESHKTETISSPSEKIALPLVIKLPNAVKLRPLKDDVIVRRVLYARDGWKCAYCEIPVTMRTATIDHVTPKVSFVRDGRPVSDAHTWDNVVTCCSPCNTKKGGRTPIEAGMRILSERAPKKPEYIQTLWAGRVYHPIQAKYIEEIYPELKNELFIRDFSRTEK